MRAQVELPKLQAAISIACRLGFATRLPNPYEGALLSCYAAPSTTQTSPHTWHIPCPWHLNGISCPNSGHLI